MLIEYLYRKSIGARGEGGGDLHKNPKHTTVHARDDVDVRSIEI